MGISDPVSIGYTIYVRIYGNSLELEFNKIHSYMYCMLRMWEH